MNPINTGLLVTNERNWRAQQNKGKSAQEKYIQRSPRIKTKAQTTTATTKTNSDQKQQIKEEHEKFEDKNLKEESKQSKESEKKKKKVKCEIM